MASSPIRTWTGLDEPDQSRFLIECHRHLVADRARTAAFLRAIDVLVTPQSVVADLGCGVGILSLGARRAGARRVFAVDVSSVVAIADAVAAVHPGPPVTTIHGASFAVALDERADVIVMDLIGGSGYNPFLVRALCDARERWLAPQGVLVPSSVEMLATIVESSDAYAPVEPWRQPLFGVDISAGAGGLLGTPAALKMAASSALSPLTSLGCIDFLTVDPRRIEGRAELHITRNGLAHGVGHAFRATLAPGVELTNVPGAPSQSERPHRMEPFVRPFPVRVGDVVDVAFSANAIADAWVMRVRHRDAGGQVVRAFETSSLDASIMSPRWRSGEGQSPEVRIPDPDAPPPEPGRTAAYARAIAEVTQADAVVATLDDRVGVFAVFAARARVRRVYAVHRAGAGGLARSVERDNLVAGLVTPLAGAPSSLALPELVDVVVADLVSRIGCRPKGARELIVAGRRWLKTGGVVVPSRVETWVAPVEHAALFAHVNFWNTPVEGFDLSAAGRWARNSIHPHTFRADELLAPGAPLLHIDFAATGDQAGPDESGHQEGHHVFVASRDGIMHGLAGWMSARLSPSVILTNAPGASGDTAATRQLGGYLPFEEPIVVRTGDEIAVTVVSHALGDVVDWSVACRRNGSTVARFSHSTRLGDLR